jgi:hypothetical protein
MPDTDEALRNDCDILRTEIHKRIAGVQRAARRYRRLSTTLLLVAMLCGGAERSAARLAQRLRHHRAAHARRHHRHWYQLGPENRGASDEGVRLRRGPRRAADRAPAGARFQRAVLDKANADLAAIRRDYAQYFF